MSDYRCSPIKLKNGTIGRIKTSGLSWLEFGSRTPKNTITNASLKPLHWSQVTRHPFRSKPHRHMPQLQRWFEFFLPRVSVFELRLPPKWKVSRIYLVRFHRPDFPMTTSCLLESVDGRSGWENSVFCNAQSRKVARGINVFPAASYYSLRDFLTNHKQSLTQHLQRSR